MMAGGVAAALLVSAAVALNGRREGPPAGVNPRHSILVLPFDNLRNDAALEGLRDGSVSTVALNLSQWDDLQVVDDERKHDLLPRHRTAATTDIGSDRAPRLARGAASGARIHGAA